MRYFDAWLLSGLVLLCSATCHAQSIQPNTRWVNQRGSILTITSIGADGQIGGSFVNHAKKFACKDDAYPINGWTDGQKISFSVRWKIVGHDCNSITAWVGYMTGAQITTEWTLVYVADSSHAPAILRESDIFKSQ